MMDFMKFLDLYEAKKESDVNIKYSYKNALKDIEKNNEIAKELLSNDGSIYVQMDVKEAHYLKIIYWHFNEGFFIYSGNFCQHNRHFTLEIF